MSYTAIHAGRCLASWRRSCSGYKLPDGKPENSFGFDEKPVDRELARQVISETHDAYKALKSGQRLNDAGLSLC